jgi:penicillin-binding protein 1A
MLLKRKKLLKKFSVFFGSTILLAVMMLLLFVFAVYKGFFGKLPDELDLLNIANERATLVLAEKGELIGKFYSEERTDVEYDQLPQHLINALIATEDARFYEHKGVDKKSLLRVLIKTLLLNDKRAGGGSTISQQLAKNIFGRQKQEYRFLTAPVNKVKEAILANRLEHIYSKEQILTLYLNKVPFGENVYGIEAASERYFNKKTEAISVEEAAVLVGMLKANTTYNPRLNPENAVERRNVVLSQMAKYGYLTQSEMDSIIELPLVLDYANLEAEGQANYFLAQVKQEAIEIINNYKLQTGENIELNTDGLIIKTTLDFELQKSANNAFRKHLTVMQKRLRNQYKYGGSRNTLMKLVNKELGKTKYTGRKNIRTKQELFEWEGFYTDSLTVKDSLEHAFTLLHAGMIALNPQTGAIKAWVGGIDFRTQPYDQILAKRQLASAFKPFLYAVALEQGFDPCLLLDNTEKTLTDLDDWKPRNSNNITGGRYSMANALAHSMNIPTVNLYFQLEFNQIAQLWRKLGFSESLVNKPALSLGAAEGSALETALAYAVFANGGYRVAPHKILSIETADGSVIYQNKNLGKKERILEQKTCLLMNEMLQKAVKEGTGKNLIKKYYVSIPMAGKTGTSQNYADAWFATYNPQLVMVSRVGASLPAISFNSGTNGTGGRLALPLVGITLQQVQKNALIRKQYYGSFPELPEEYKLLMDCPDFVEDKGIRKFFKSLQKKETTLEKEKKRAARKRKRSLRNTQ